MMNFTTMEQNKIDIHNMIQHEHVNRTCTITEDPRNEIMGKKRKENEVHLEEVPFVRGC